VTYFPIGPHAAAHSVSVVLASDSLVSEVAPAAQASTNDWTDLAGSTIDTQNFLSLAYTLVNTGAQTIQWKVLGANAADFSDVQEVQAAADVLAGGIASYSTQIAVWRYYKVQIHSKVDGAHGQATLRGIAKAG